MSFFKNLNIIATMFYHLIGANAAQSVLNLQGWLDAIANRVTRGGDPLVKDSRGTREPSLFHRMKCGEHFKFLTCLTHSAVNQDCVAAGISAGKLYSLEPSSRGSLEAIQIELGFFF